MFMLYESEETKQQVTISKGNTI